MDGRIGEMAEVMVGVICINNRKIVGGVGIDDCNFMRLYILKSSFLILLFLFSFVNIRLSSFSLLFTEIIRIYYLISHNFANPQTSY